MTSSRTLGLALGLSLLTPLTAAQLCADPTDTFWKNDTLAQVPGGLTAVSIIPGLCEGEAAAQVFYLPPGSPSQKLNKVSVGFGDQFGAGGFNAVVNVEIYDGITWNGSLPTLGTKVFDLADDTASSLRSSATASTSST